jgi:cytochrome c
MSRNLSRYLRALAPWLAMVLAVPSALASDASAPLSSSFPGPLWDVIAPMGGTAAVANAHLTLSVPGGSNHDSLLPSNQALRVVQNVNDSNFDVSIKIDSAISAKDANTSQGLMVLADNQNFLTFDVATNGTNISLEAHKVSGGVATTVFQQAPFNEYHNPVCLRIARSGDTYTAYYSVDGVVWTEATTFADTLAPAQIGPFAGNYNSAPAKAVPVVMAINWFDIL